MHNSGKQLIVAMLLVALVAASASWWVRYLATHRAAQFWGPAAARLIRDAPHVELLTLRPTPRQILRTEFPPAAPAPQPNDEFRLGTATFPVDARRDISAAPGLTHLRNALLEDRSFIWGGTVLSDHDELWTTAIVFRAGGASESIAILFLSDFTRAWVRGPGDSQLGEILTRPIAAGLAETINDWSQLPAIER